MKLRSLKLFILTTIICMVLAANVAFSSQENNSRENSSLNFKEEIISSHVKFLKNTLYFNFSIKNEEVNGTYSLIKIDKSGLITILQEKQCVPNKINQAILYSFVQKEVAENDGIRYLLLRISKEKGVEVLGSYGKPVSLGEEKSLVTSVRKSSQCEVFYLK